MLDLISIIGRNAVPTYIFAEVDATLLEKLRACYEKRGTAIPLAALLIKAISIAQRSHPESRAFGLPFGRRANPHEVVAGFTVERLVGNSTNPAVFVGAIEGADAKPLEEITEELAAYEEADMDTVCLLKQQRKFSNLPWIFRRIFLWLSMRSAQMRAQHLRPTFMLSSAGKFGSKLLIPPSITTSAFGVGCIEPRAVVKEGKIQIRPMLSIALNFDHTVIDGAPAARFLKDVCEVIETGLTPYVPELLEEREEQVSTLAPA
jgi:pyruvate/2-oxoglutarate dehydrogenase complex dihydrolipoamide acyltransferase (E2) component